MPHSFCQMAAHIIFGLKNHQKFLNDSFHPYITGIITHVKGHPIAINGTQDHIHILCYLPRDMSMAEFVKTIKSNSSKWHNEKSLGIMHWQSGYAAFSVSHDVIPKVQGYIDHQKEHHKKMSFDEELKQMFERTGLMHLWDKWTRDR